MSPDDGLVQLHDGGVVGRHVGKRPRVHGVFRDSQAGVARTLHGLLGKVLVLRPLGQLPVELVGELVDPEVQTGLHAAALCIGKQFVQQSLGGSHPFPVGGGAGQFRVHQLASPVEKLAADGLRVNRDLPTIVQNPGDLGLVSHLVVNEGLVRIDLRVEDIELHLGQLVDQVAVVLHSIKDQRGGQVVDGPVGTKAEAGLPHQVQLAGRERLRDFGEDVFLQQETDARALHQLVDRPQGRRRAASPQDEQIPVSGAHPLQDDALVAHPRPGVMSRDGLKSGIGLGIPQEDAEFRTGSQVPDQLRPHAVELSQIADQLMGGKDFQVGRFGAQDNGAAKGLIPGRSLLDRGNGRGPRRAQAKGRRQ